MEQRRMTGETDEIYFFDTYAIIEIVKGNINYEKYKNCKIVISLFNLAELHYSILKESQKIANQIIEKYSPFVVKTDIETIKDANVFRLNNKSKNLSPADCIGYTTSKKMNIKFLTGDKEFNGLSNVEFVK